jgi:hypothetical protein
MVQSQHSPCELEMIQVKIWKGCQEAILLSLSINILQIFHTEMRQGAGIGRSNNDSVIPHYYTRLHYQGIVSPYCYNRQPCQVTQSNHTATRAHPTKGHSLNSMLQQAAVPRVSESPYCHSPPLCEGNNCHPPLKSDVHTTAKILTLFFSVTRPAVCWMGTNVSEPEQKAVTKKVSNKLC